MKQIVLITLPQISVWLLLACVCYSTETDVLCLKLLKKSIHDPQNYLQWDFTNTTEGSICNFLGVECWHAGENRVLNLQLSDMQLSGSFPSGLENCSSLTSLDLSRNNFSGHIPSSISQHLTFITKLDLSFNKFDGEIPPGLANCTFLNVLELQYNQLEGMIPSQLVLLDRLKTLNVEGNLLTGQIPHFRDNVTTEFGGNPGLCGKEPYGFCGGKKTNVAVIVGAACGGVVVSILLVLVLVRFWCKPPAKKKHDVHGNKWVKSIKGSKNAKVLMFEESVTKMRLGDLMKATNHFSDENIIHVGRTGATYKATLPNGTLLAIKRLHKTHHNEKQFSSEMTTLGNVWHKNLVPLLGYCTAKRERLLVYKHMTNGSLHDLLHRRGFDAAADWPLRLRICIGAAKGFAFLHHSCNPRILHRNVSSKCILLDEDYDPKISDFGLARLMNPVDTHLSTFVNGEFGEFGYVAPEYASTLMATPKGDVYSFGIIILELVTGEKPNGVSRAPEGFGGSLVEWVTYLSNNSLLQDAVDKSLIGKGCDDELLQVLKIGCACTLSAAKERPTMFEVYQLLRSVGEKYHFIADEPPLPSLNGETETRHSDELIVAC